MGRGGSLKTSSDRQKGETSERFCGTLIPYLKGIGVGNNQYRTDFSSENEGDAK